MTIVNSNSLEERMLKGILDEMSELKTLEITATGLIRERVTGRRVIVEGSIEELLKQMKDPTRHSRMLEGINEEAAKDYYEQLEKSAL